MFALGDKNAISKSVTVAVPLKQKRASWCRVKGIFFSCYLANSCPLFEHMWQAALWLSGQISLIKQLCLVSAKGRQLGYSYGGRWPAPSMFSLETNPRTVHTVALFCTCNVILVRLCVHAYKLQSKNVVPGCEKGKENAVTEHPGPSPPLRSNKRCQLKDCH